MEGLSRVSSFTSSVLTELCQIQDNTGCARIGSWGRVGDITTCLPN